MSDDLREKIKDILRNSDCFVDGVHYTSSSHPTLLITLSLGTKYYSFLLDENIMADSSKEKEDDYIYSEVHRSVMELVNMTLIPPRGK